MKTLRIWFNLVLIGLLTGCNLLASNDDDTNSNVRAWFDAPLPNTVILPPNPCQIVAHGASPAGISQFELKINGANAVVIPSLAGNETLAAVNQDCGLTDPGEYLLQIRAQDNDGNWSGYAQTTLIISGGETATPPSDGTPASVFTAIPTLTATPLPTSTPTPQPAGGTAIERVSTNLVYFGDTSCGTNEVTILARAAAPNGIKVVILFYRFATDNSSNEFQSIAMNPLGGDLFQATLNPTSLLGGSAPFEQATLQYQVVVQQNNGDTSIRTPVLADIAMQACGRVTASCSSFTEKRACIANGCNWVEIPSAVPLFECRSP